MTTTQCVLAVYYIVGYVVIGIMGYRLLKGIAEDSKASEKWWKEEEEREKRRNRSRW